MIYSRTIHHEHGFFGIADVDTSLPYVGFFVHLSILTAMDKGYQFATLSSYVLYC